MLVTRQFANDPTLTVNVPLPLGNVSFSVRQMQFEQSYTHTQD